MHADVFCWLFCDEIVDHSNEVLCLIFGWRFAVSTALHFRVPAVIRLYFLLVVISVGVGEIDPKAKLFLKMKK